MEMDSEQCNSATCVSVKAEKKNVTKGSKQKNQILHFGSSRSFSPNKTLKVIYGTITTKQLEDITITCLENSALCPGQYIYVQ